METFYGPDQYHAPKTVDEARLAIAAALEDPDFIEKAIHANDGPLTRDTFPLEATHTAGFREADSVFGWPDLEDRGITPPHDYSDVDFVANLYDNDAHNKNPRSLGNFTARLRAKPILDMRDASAKLSDLYGICPELHRAYAVMPEVMFALNTIFNELAQLANNEARVAWLGLPANADIVTVTNMVYRIMGRLVRASDKRDAEGKPLVSDAHTALTE
ncbi:TPA: hypothetical protein DIV49_01910 [Candidatus Saccharibacteria bacterium]|nr:hypothetical protein [Candidatus Saccharibacteria bacterium]HRJ90742.1 hypothetical protein [Candidatus Saccharibacteria bacterium]